MTTTLVVSDLHLGARTRIDVLRRPELRRPLLDAVAGADEVVLLGDVLEHLVDPWAALRGAVAMLGPGAVAVVSVPNVLFFGALARVVRARRWPREDEGIFDRTHLRWFTPRDIVAAVGDAGWEVVSTGHPPLGRSATLDRLTRGRATQFVVGQWFVLARAPR